MKFNFILGDTMKFLKFLTIFSLVFFVSFSASAQTVKADNVNFVSYRFQGTVSELRFIEGKKWSEKWKGETYNYVEESQDEWSVYLLNPELNSRLQIDLFKKMVIYVEDGKKVNSPIIKALSQ
jgi:hypothetical protein